MPDKTNDKGISHVADIDLNELSLEELKQLKKQVDRAVASFADRKKAEARGELEEAARKLGFSLADFSGQDAVRRRAPAQAKYRHPENSEISWSGRGRKPKWFEDYISSGKSLDDLII